MKETVVVFSHLRWHSVFQRPHHLLSRIGKSQRVLFIEEPVFDERSEPDWVFESPSPGVVVCIPHTPILEPGFCSAQLEVLGTMLPKLMRELRVSRHIAWFYTPMAVALIDCIDPEIVIYDCMDALDAFLNAPPLLKQCEQQLLDRADVVFTGGPSLFGRLESRHAHVHCFPSSVDAAHFGQSLNGCEEPAEQKLLAKPRLGFFGVIDERIDLELLDALAANHPDWQIIMVGPVVKISPDVLPRRPNIHYLGQRNYVDLPGYVAGWDVCLMPFARNDATRYISPTKVLEYMATERPIVSTQITDVAVPYGHIVYVADTANEFVEACEEALAASVAERERRAALMRRVLSNTSWDRTVEDMRLIIADSDRSPSTKTRPELGAAGVSRLSAREHSNSHVSKLQHTQTAIIGAGPTGLSAAFHLGQDCLLLEQNREIGGWCRSIREAGFTFDFAGHIMFSNEPYVHEMYKKLLCDNVHWQDREAWISLSVPRRVVWTSCGRD
jgi:UDP-galactopyranose mutase